MPSVIRIQVQGKVKAATYQDMTSHPALTDLDTMIPLIQALIPLGLQAFAEVMQAEVAQRAGPKYSRTGGQPNCVRWGRQPGSIFLADQKVPVPVQRVRDQARRQELPLQSYQQLQTPVQRCQWHKRENVVAYLPEGHRGPWRRKLQAAYQQPTYAEAKAALLRLHQELRLLNESAARSLLEGLEETLTLHRLVVFPQLGLSLKTTNCLESLNSLVAQRVGKVDRWRTSDQKQRWLAASLLDIEPRLRRIKGFRALPLLRQALRTAVQGGEATAAIQAA
jgi:hypothetical protein